MTRRPDQRSDAAREWRKLYNKAAWKAARKAQLQRQPLCELCQERGRITTADVVNHRKPHKGDWALFIDSGNHQSLCEACHNGPVQTYEKGGWMPGCDSSGIPLDAGHPWNRN